MNYFSMYIAIYNIYIPKVILDGITIYIFGPISALLIESAGKYTSLLELNYIFQHTKSTVKDEKLIHVSDTIFGAQQ